MEAPRLLAVLVLLAREAIAPALAGGLLLFSPARGCPGRQDAQAFAGKGCLLRGRGPRFDAVFLVRAADDRQELAEARPDLV